MLFLALVIAVIGYQSLQSLRTSVQTTLDEARRIRELSLEFETEYLQARQTEAHSEVSAGDGPAARRPDASIRRAPRGQSARQRPTQSQTISMVYSLPESPVRTMITVPLARAALTSRRSSFTAVSQPGQVMPSQASGILAPT